MTTAMMWWCWMHVRMAARRLARGELGNSVVEYALLVSLVAVLCVAAVATLGATNGESLSRSASHLR